MRLVNSFVRMKKLVISFFALVLFAQNAVGQCAMCRTTVENNVSNGEIGIAAGLNIGILYLFVTPYLLATVIGVLWYRSSRKQKKKPSLKDLLSRKSPQ